MACLDMLGRSHTATQAYELVLDGLVSHSGVINQVPRLTNELPQFNRLTNDI